MPVVYRAQGAVWNNFENRTKNEENSPNSSIFGKCWHNESSACLLRRFAVTCCKPRGIANVNRHWDNNNKS